MNARQNSGNWKARLTQSVRRGVGVSILLVCTAMSLAAAEPGGGRLALVVGVGDYGEDGHWPDLANAIADAELVAEALAEAGFELKVLKNPDGQELLAAADAIEKAEDIVFYFAGHGIQKDGRNFLFGINGAIDPERGTIGQGVAVGEMIDRLGKHNPANLLVFLDCCRNLTDVVDNQRDALRAGLAAEQYPNMALCYAASPGMIAIDEWGNFSNGPFAAALAKHIVGNAEITQLLKNVRNEVHYTTEGRQTPFSASNLTGDFFMRSADENTVAEYREELDTLDANDIRSVIKAMTSLQERCPPADELTRSLLIAEFYHYKKEVMMRMTGGAAQELSLTRRAADAFNPSQHNDSNTTYYPAISNWARNYYLRRLDLDAGIEVWPVGEGPAYLTASPGWMEGSLGRWLPEEWFEFFEIENRDLRNSWFHDAYLGISTEELLDRIILAEEFLEKNRAFPLRDLVESIVRGKLSVFLYGDEINAPLESEGYKIALDRYVNASRPVWIGHEEAWDMKEIWHHEDDPHDVRVQAKELLAERWASQRKQPEVRKRGAFSDDALRRELSEIPFVGGSTIYLGSFDGREAVMSLQWVRGNRFRGAILSAGSREERRVYGRAEQYDKWYEHPYELDLELWSRDGERETALGAGRFLRKDRRNSWACWEGTAGRYQLTFGLPEVEMVYFDSAYAGKVGSAEVVVNLESNEGLITGSYESLTSGRTYRLQGNKVKKDLLYLDEYTEDIHTSRILLKVSGQGETEIMSGTMFNLDGRKLPINWAVTPSDHDSSKAPDQGAVNGYRKAAEQGDASAQNSLGKRYANGEGVPQDYKEAVKWFRLAAEQGDALAQCNLGLCYSNGEGVPKDYAEALKWYRKAAQQGDAGAQNSLGVCYLNGEGVPKDYAEAVKWYRRAAEQGNAVGQSNLGGCYYEGEGVPKDYAEAVKWYRLAADQGYARAQTNLGACYATGDGVPQDYAEAERWFRLAAEQGYAEAQYNLGVCYANGYGVPQDYAEAVRWYRLAAEQGNAEAPYNLGWCYYNGRGVSQDFAEAVKWYRMAAEQGDAAAGQFMLGICYINGTGVTQDDVLAYMWFTLARASGDENAKANMERLSERMTREELGEAQRLSFAELLKRGSQAKEK